MLTANKQMKILSRGENDMNEKPKLNGNDLRKIDGFLKEHRKELNWYRFNKPKVRELDILRNKLHSILEILEVSITKK